MLRTLIVESFQLLYGHFAFLYSDCTSGDLACQLLKTVQQLQISFYTAMIIWPPNLEVFPAECEDQACPRYKRTQTCTASLLLVNSVHVQSLGTVMNPVTATQAGPRAFPSCSLSLSLSPPNQFLFPKSSSDSFNALQSSNQHVWGKMQVSHLQYLLKFHMSTVPSSV